MSLPPVVHRYIDTDAIFLIPHAARLPFKRLNPEPKENELPKRPCGHACPEPEVTDRENENQSSPLSVLNRPPLVNGRGPLDGFLSHRRPSALQKNIIDLTNDNSSSPLKSLVSDAPASLCCPSKDKHSSKDKFTSGKLSNVDHTPKTHASHSTVDNSDGEREVEEKDGDQITISKLDITQESDSEPDDQNESGNISSLGNRSMLSASSVSSMSDSEPEKTMTDDDTPVATAKVCTSHIVCLCSSPLCCVCCINNIDIGNLSANNTTIFLRCLNQKLFEIHKPKVLSPTIHLMDFSNMLT